MTIGVHKRFVEPGRLCHVAYGPNEGKLVVVIDIIDLRRVVVDGHFNGVTRQVLPVKWISLTDFKCNIDRQAKRHTLMEALKKEQILEKFAKTSWGQKIENQKKRANMSDLDRFKVMVVKKKLSQARREGSRQHFKALKGKGSKKK